MISEPHQHRQWNDNSGGDWIKAELIMGLSQSVAEELLCKHWDHLCFSSYYFQAALYVSTPQLLDLAATTIKTCPEPRELFTHICSHFGIRTDGRPGITRKQQIEGLIPYLDQIDELDIYHFWEVCNERGWINFRKEHLDNRLGKWREKTGLDDESLFRELDRELSHDHTPWLDHWVERRLKDGRTVDGILKIIQEWLQINRTAKAVEIAASVIIHAGTRVDLKILNDGHDKSLLAEEIIADASFAIHRRTLM